MKNFQKLILVLVGFSIITIGYGKNKPNKRPISSAKQDKAYRKNQTARLKYEQYLQQLKKEPERFKGITPDYPEDAVMQEFVMTADPQLKRIPSERMESVYKLLDSQKQKNNSLGPWVEMGPDNLAGRTRAIAFDPATAGGKKVWCGGADGGLWTCNDITSANPVWVQNTSVWTNLAITSISFDNNMAKGYLSTGEGYRNIDAVRGNGIWTTNNGGSLWTNLSSTNKWNYVLKVKVHPVNSSIFACTRDSGLFKSFDGGLSWTKVLGAGTGSLSDEAADISICSSGVGVFCSMGLTSTDGIYYSLTGDAGTWTKCSGGLPTSGFKRIDLAGAPSDPNTIYALMCADDNSAFGLYYSSDKGLTWQSIPLPQDSDPDVTPTFTRNQAWYDLSIAVGPNDPQKIIVGGVNLFATTDRGANWSQISHWADNFSSNFVHADQHIVCFRPGTSDEVLAGCDGGVFKITSVFNSGRVISAINNKLNTGQFYSCAISPDIDNNAILGGTQDNGTYLLDQIGMNSKNEVLGGDGGFCFFKQENPEIAISSYIYNNYYLSKDGGKTFDNTLLNENTGLFINASDYDSFNDILFTGKSNTEILSVKNVSGNFYQKVLTVPDMGSKVSHIKVSPFSLKGSVIFVGTQSGRLFRINNADSSGVSKEIGSSSFPTANISCIETGKTENELMVSFSNYGVTSLWYTKDGGLTWSNKEGNLPDMPVRWVALVPDSLNAYVLGTQAGVWYCNNISVTSPVWTFFGSNLPYVRTDMIKFRPGDHLLIAATHGRGMFYSNAFLNPNIKPTAAFQADTVMDCNGVLVHFKNNSTLSKTYQWYFPGGEPESSTEISPTVRYRDPGSFDVTLISSRLGVSDSLFRKAYIKSSNGNAPNLKLIPSAIKMYAGDLLTIGGAHNHKYNFIYRWSIDDRVLTEERDSLLEYRPEANALFTLEVWVDGVPGGCYDKKSVYIDVDIPCREPYVFIPSAFSPDGNGVNDRLRVKGLTVDKVYLDIYDRFGGKIIEVRDNEKGWDGTFNGKPLDPGVFLYKLKVECTDKVIFTKDGFVTLLK